MSRSILRSHKKFIRVFSIILGVLLLLPLIGFAVFNIYYRGHIFPGISVASFDLGGLTKEEAESLLSKNINTPQNIKLVYEGQIFNLDAKKIKLSYDFQKSANDAFDLTRNGTVASDLYQRIYLLIYPKNLSLEVNFDDGSVSKFVSVIAGQISVPPVAPSIIINRPKVTVNKGSTGLEVDQEKLLSQIKNQLAYGNGSDIQIPVSYIDQTINDAQAQTLETRAENILGKSITLNFEFNSYTVSDSDILTMFNPTGGYDDQKIIDYLNKVAAKINRDPQNPKFTFESGRVSEFQPSLDGVIVKINDLENQVVNALTQLERTADKSEAVDVPVDRTPAEVSTNQVNNLGIKELIGRGTSTFYHSIPSRVHNVVLAASRINGVLVKPGVTFSFNDTLGDVSQFTGYQQAYIIQNGRTVLGDGGGVCQVSTTLFRAALNAGLPIIERAAHAYRVGYYEQNSPPGFDATVYGPSPDLKFKNDTPGYVLIEAVADPKNYSLIFELYGSSDGRVATVTKPVISNVTPALPTIYQDDPTLPTGTLKQTDFSAAGARVTFNYKVVRDGQTLTSKTFISNYQPWAAVYLRGTGPAI